MRVSLITLGDPERLSGGYLYHRRMAAAARRHDACLRFISFPRAPFPLPAAAGVRVLSRVRAQAPDVVVLDSIAAAYLAPWATRTNVPLAASVHQVPGGIDNSAARALIQARLDLHAYRGAGRIMVASDSLRADLVRRGVAEDKVSVVPPGRDVAPAPSGPLDDLRRGRRCALLCVANWMRRKGITELLDAVARLPADLVTLHLVGDDRAERRYARRVRARLRDATLRDRVVVHGAISSRDVASMYAAADAFVLPSVAEPYGTVYGEAMAAGLPVVGWDAGNLPHLADDGVEGFVVPRGDVGALSAGLRRISEDEALRTRMGAAARERSGALPTWEESSRAFFGELRSIADPPGARRTFGI
jgi:glycosyltransferase involved in cell wall biosynthesis